MDREERDRESCDVETRDRKREREREREREIAWIVCAGGWQRGIERAVTQRRGRGGGG
jgi:hypothetical protein